ncbi:MAG TPA: DUF222 domain-containing protein [Nocardioidaceae bacterium]|nr:DUF222 domain-containing protein [Nocardioidaceae bacterium]
MSRTFPGVAELEAFLARLAGTADTASDSERIDLIAELEKLKGAAAAAQARLTAAFDASQRTQQADQGVHTKKQGLGVAGQVALARRDSPNKGARHLGLAKALVHEMPHTLRALTAGRISEWRATILVRETAVLSAEHRSSVDAALADRIAHLGDAGVKREAMKLAYQLDPASVLRRNRRAYEERRVSIRPAPDTMSYVTGLLPVAQGVAVHAALTKHADALRATGDQRSRGQIMADTFVERLTGQARAGDVPVEVQLVMTDRTLLGGDDTPARVVGYGPIPAALGRALIRAGSAGEQARVWVRRLFTNPVSGDLIAMDSRRREFPVGLRRFFVIRDEVCRTPWCDAPIRHADHLVRAADGGATSADNGQGLCEACNQAKEAPGWQTSATRAGPGHAVTVRTPTGHSYMSTPPDLPGGRPPVAAVRHSTGYAPSAAEERLQRLLVPA